MNELSNPAHVYEEQIIATIFTAPKLLFEADGIKPNHFGDERLGRVYQAMLDVTAKGEQPDIVNVGMRLDDLDNRTHWMKILMDLVNRNVSNPKNFKAYTKVILDQHQERSQQFAAEKYALDVRNGDSESALQNLIISLADTHIEYHSGTKSSLERVVDNLDQVHTGKIKPGVLTGIEKIDDRFGGFHNGDLIVIGARPAMGKTAFMCNLILNADVPVGVITAEQGTDELMQRLIAIDGRIDSEKFRNAKFDDVDWANLSGSVARLTDKNVSFYDNGAPTIEDVVQAAMQMKYRDGIGILFVDYIQRIKGKGENRNLQIGDVSWGLKALAKRLKIPVVALCQVNRSVESRKNKRPLMSDLKESGDIEQDADQIAFLYRDAVYDDQKKDNVMEIDYQKNRHGNIGTVYAKWDPTYLTIRSDREVNG